MIFPKPERNKSKSLPRHKYYDQPQGWVLPDRPEELLWAAHLSTGELKAAQAAPHAQETQKHFITDRKIMV